MSDADGLIVIHQTTISVDQRVPPLFVTALSTGDVDEIEEVPFGSKISAIVGGDDPGLTYDRWIGLTRRIVPESTSDMEEMLYLSWPLSISWRVSGESPRPIVEALQKLRQVATPAGFAQANLLSLLNPAALPAAMWAVVSDGRRRTKGPVPTLWPVVGTAPAALLALATFAMQSNEIDVSNAELAMWLQVASGIILKHPQMVRAVATECLSVDVSFSRSPRASKSPLSDLIEGAHKAAVVALTAGAGSASTLLAQRHVLLGLECAVGSGATAIVLVAAGSMAAGIEQYLRRPRRRRR